LLILIYLNQLSKIWNPSKPGMSDPRSLIASSFEKELLKKLSQKASGSQSEETVLTKCFKYFDLNNNGTIEPEEFGKAIEKVGIMIPTKRVRQLRFNTLILGLGFSFQPLRH